MNFKAFLTLKKNRLSQKCPILNCQDFTPTLSNYRIPEVVFSSIDFLLFILVVWLVFRQLKNQNHMKFWLLFCSLFFYGYWHWEYLVLLITASSLDFWASLQIEKASDQKRKKLFLIASLSSNLLLLCYFKYGLFLGKQLVLTGICTNTPNWLEILLPVGISFYTFQAMGYVIDVYRTKVKAEKSFTQFLFFISFFPQLVAGPIERAPNLLHQLRYLKIIVNHKIIPAISLIIFGFWKKLFLADRLSVYVDFIFENTSNSNAYQIITASFLFGIQIYCDFSGYSDIARGIARFFGIELMVNFDRPYFAPSLSEFWRRWHISLSGWFRDYIYFPMGGSLKLPLQTIFNILIVFGLSGLWHGANWTFLIWGLWHGLGLIAERFTLSKLKPIYLRWLSLGWIFAGWTIFRANSLHDLTQLSKRLCYWPKFNFLEYNAFHSTSELFMAIFGIAILAAIEVKWLILKTFFQQSLSVKSQLAILLSSLAFLLWFGAFKGQDFIYFQF